MRVFFWIIVAATHFIVQFIAWSYAPGNSAPSIVVHEGLRRTAWMIVSFPVLWVRYSLIDQYFWALLILNSVVWAGFFWGITALLSKRSRVQ
jgi:hypothetical protein